MNTQCGEGITETMGSCLRFGPNDRAGRHAAVAPARKERRKAGVEWTSRCAHSRRTIPPIAARFAAIILSSLVGLLATGCGPGTPSTSLHAAVQEGNYPAIRKHIAARSDLNAKDASGWTPLHLAAGKGDLAMVQLLAEAGADPKRAGPQGKTPVDTAREKGQTSIVQFLEARLANTPGDAQPQQRGRGLIDGGLGVSETLDAL